MAQTEHRVFAPQRRIRHVRWDKLEPIVDRPRHFQTLVWLWLAASTLVLAWGLRLALFVAPTEATMGDVQRIFYWHVPINIVSFIFPYVNLAGSVWLLAVRNTRPAQALKADALALAGAELTVLYSSLGLITGILWARPVWGIWWTWDARLTTFLLLWVLYVAYLLLRRFSSTGNTAVLAAVLGVFAAIDVPICYMSIEWWRTQHPSPVLRGEGQLDPTMRIALYWNLLGWAMWGAGLLAMRYTLERRRQHLLEEEAMHSIEDPLEVAS